MTVRRVTTRMTVPLCGGRQHGHSHHGGQQQSHQIVADKTHDVPQITLETNYQGNEGRESSFQTLFRGSRRRGWPIVFNGQAGDCGGSFPGIAEGFELFQVGLPK